MRPYVYIAVLFVPVSGIGVFAQQPRGMEMATSSFLANRLNAASDSEIGRFVVGEDASLALHARWFRLVRGHEQVVRLPGDELAAFVGFVEGRLRVESPVCWKEWLRANYEADAEVLRRPLSEEVLRHEDGPRLIKHSDGISVILEDGKAVKISLPTRRSGSPPECSVCVFGGNVFVADHTNKWGAIPILCVDLDSRLERWKSEIWGVELPPVNARLHMQLVTSEKWVVAFGSGGGFAFVEAFDLESGTPRVRFSTEECRYRRVAAQREARP